MDSKEELQIGEKLYLLFLQENILITLVGCCAVFHFSIKVGALTISQ